MALFLPLGARFYSGLSGPGMKLFDRHNPRGFIETLNKTDMDAQVCIVRYSEQTCALI
jgi:hypothetical protein